MSAEKITPHLSKVSPKPSAVTEGAVRLGVARHTLSRVIHGHAGVSPEMAIRLEKMGWSNARAWLTAQSVYDLAQARKKESRIRVAPLEAVGD